MLRLCFLVLIASVIGTTTATALSRHPQRPILAPGPPNECTARVIPDNYWIECPSLPCPGRAKPISGSCAAGDTRGSSIVIESFGVVGDKWVCRYVDARKLGTGATLDGNLKVTSTALCLGR